MVSRSIWPKVWKAKMEPITAAKKIVGDSDGTVTRQKRVQVPAPSTLAPPWRSSGTDCRPADIKMKLSPRFCQIVVTATAGRARVGLLRIAGLGLMPSHGKSPTSGLIRVPKTTDATATDVAIVDEKMVR